MPQRLCLLVALAVTAIAHAQQGDWPQWRGPERNGISKEAGLLKTWPADGPKLLWKATGLGGGFSTPSVAGGKIYVMGSKGQPDRGAKGSFPESVLCLDAKDGKELWATEIGKTRGGSPGPRSTPTVSQGRAYAISSDGILACLDAKSGELVWKKDLVKDFGGRSGGWAYTESPLVDGDVLVCTPGGSKATMVALDVKTGNEVWRSDAGTLKADPRKGNYQTAGYSSVIATQSHGVKQYVQFFGGGVAGVDAKTGKALWHYNSPSNGTANCSTPLFKDDSVFAASAYSTGGGRAKIVREGNGFKAEEAYFITKMQNHHGGMVLVGDHVYGTGGAALLCIDFKAGTEAGSARSAGKGSIVYADGHIYHRGENGTMCLVEATPALKEKGRLKQPQRSGQPAWAHPVVAGGRLYLRDWDALYCYDVKGE